MMHCACLQGFPDYFALVGQQTGAPSAFNSQVRSGSQDARYTQMGNAVCPLVSAAMGRCLARSASHNHPADADQFVISVPDPDYVEVTLFPHPTVDACLLVAALDTCCLQLHEEWLARSWAV